MKFRILSVVLILALVCSLLPASVLATSPVHVLIGGVTLVDGQYLPSYGTSLSATPGENGYAVLNGNVLTLCDFAWEGTVYGAGSGVLEDVDAEAYRAAIQISGDIIVNLIGNSSVITGSYAAVDSNADLTVCGTGSLRLYGKLNGLIAENFVMESGMLQVRSGLGGNGIVVKDNVTFMGGDLLIDADYGFYSFDYDNYDDPVITVAPAEDTLTVRYGTHSGKTHCCEFTQSGTVEIRSDEAVFERFWFTDRTNEVWPELFAAPYDLQVAGVYVTEENCSDVLRDGTVRFDPATCTLTLNQADLRYRGRVIYAWGMDLTIDALGSNHLVSTGATPIHLDRGVLTVCGDELSTEGILHGIFAFGDVHLSNVSLTAQAQQHAIFLPEGYSLELQQAQVTTLSTQNIGINLTGDLFIKDSCLDNTGAADGLDAKNLVILNSNVTTHGNEDGAWLNGALRIENSEVNFSGKQNAVQVKIGTTIIEDSIVTATSRGTGGSMDIAIYAEKGISIERSIVTATSPAGTPAIACINGNGPFEAECSLSIAQVTAPNKSTQIWTFVDDSGNYISNVFLEQRSEILYFGEVEIAETETAFVTVYDSDGKLLYIDVPEVISGRTLLILPEAAAEQMSQAKLFIMDAVTLALSQDAIEPK